MILSRMCHDSHGKISRSGTHRYLGVRGIAVGGELATTEYTMQSLTSIVVGTDFTPCSAVALGQAIRIAKWFSSSVHVVHVIDTTVVIEIESALSPMQQGIRDGLTKDAQRAWVDFAKNIPGAAGLPIEVSINNRIVGLLRRARADKADLLVMGAFGHRCPDVGFGTVATACVRKSMSDVLLVRDTQKGPFKIIVAAVDFSQTSARALARAAHFAAQDGAELHVLHVFSAPWRELSFADTMPLIPPHMEKDYRDGLERQLAEFARPIASAHPDLRLRTICYDTNTHRSGIVEYAKSASADLIVLGTRGRTNLRDILLGSTAEKALAASHCSILAVKPEAFEHPLAAGDAQPTMTMNPPM
jgi:universal stress protein E